jgi:hypothetical protein
MVADHHICRYIPLGRIHPSLSSLIFMGSRLRCWPGAVLLLLTWCVPAQAGPLFAQEGPSQLSQYVVALAAVGVVLLVVCWPAKRGE